MMQYKHGAFWLALVVCLAVAGAAFPGSGHGAEARRLVIDPGTFVEMPSETTVETMSLGTGHTGPRIELRRPGNDSVFRADEPVTVHVEFLPAADGTAPNMATLNVRVRKGWFGKDITDVVQPYVEGAAVRVPEVDFSGHTGDFRFEISVRDYRDRTSETEFQVTIEA